MSGPNESPDYPYDLETPGGTHMTILEALLEIEGYFPSRMYASIDVEAYSWITEAAGRPPPRQRAVNLRLYLGINSMKPGASPDDTIPEFKSIESLLAWAREHREDQAPGVSDIEIDPVEEN